MFYSTGEKGFLLKRLNPIARADDRRWSLYSKAKGKYYFFHTLEEAFTGAKNIADF
jgi:hypothetical protein